MSEPDSAEVQAVVRHARPSLESVPYATVVIGFANRGAARVDVRAYDLVWPEGRFSVTDSKIALGPGEARDFTVRVPVASGNIDALIADATRARVERLETRTVATGSR
jgi:hypothetical protein